jgi:hypothetical protein
MEAKDGSMGFDFAGADTKSFPKSALESARLKSSISHDQGVNVRVVFDGKDTHPVEMQRGGWQAI